MTSANSSGLEPRLRLHDELERLALRGRRTVELAGGHLDVLLLQRGGDIGDGEAVGGELVRIDPDALGILAAAEHRDVADAVETEQLVADVQVDVVGEVVLVVGLVGREQMHDQHQVGRGLAHGDAEVAHVRRQTRLGDRKAVLHQHVGDIEVGADLEGHRQQHVAVVGRQRRHVEHVVDAVDLLLDRRRDGGGHRLGVGARIGGADGHRRRHDLGILRDRQRLVGDEAEDQEDDRRDGREDRSVDEEMGETHRSNLMEEHRPVQAGCASSVSACAPRRWRALRARGTAQELEAGSIPRLPLRVVRAAPPGAAREIVPPQVLLGGNSMVSGVTLAPGRTREMPLTTTVSSPFSPSWITR